MNLGDRESDLRQLRELHRRAVAPLVKACLGDHPDPDLRAFAAALPDQVDSVEAYLKRFWAERGYQAGAIGLCQPVWARPGFLPPVPGVRGPDGGPGPERRHPGLRRPVPGAGGVAQNPTAL